MLPDASRVLVCVMLVNGCSFLVRHLSWCPVLRDFLSSAVRLDDRGSRPTEGQDQHLKTSHLMGPYQRMESVSDRYNELR